MKTGALVLRPLSLIDILDESFRIYRASFPVFAVCAVGLAVPLAALTLLAGDYRLFSLYVGLFQHPDQPPVLPDLGLGSLGWRLLQYPVIAVMLPFYVGPVVLAACETIQGRPVSIASVLRACLHRYWALWVLGFIYLSSVSICLPIAIWLLPRLVGSASAIFVEGASLGTSLERSWYLTRKSWWRTFGVLILTVILANVVTSAVSPLFVGLTALAPGLSLDAHAALLIAVAYLCSQLAWPLYGIVAALVYFDLRVRKEAFDLERMAYDQLRGPALSSAP